MLYFYSGTDRDKARSTMGVEIERTAKRGKARIARITDANSLDDLQAALQGPGMFGEPRVLVFEDIFTREDMRDILFEALARLKESKEEIFLFEEKVDAATRKRIEKYAESSARHDAAKGERDNSIFALSSALKRGDKKVLWVGYQAELAKGNAPEAIHGILFWGAKQLLLSARKGSGEEKKGTTLVSELAELPHAARRRGFELEYALEHFVLGIR